MERHRQAFPIKLVPSLQYLLVASSSFARNKKPPTLERQGHDLCVSGWQWSGHHRSPPPPPPPLPNSKNLSAGNGPLGKEHGVVVVVVVVGRKQDTVELR